MTVLTCFGNRHEISEVQLEEDDTIVLEFAEDQAILVAQKPHHHDDEADGNKSVSVHLSHRSRSFGL